MNASTDHARTSALLTCGTLVAPVFFGVALVELLLRPEFDIHKLPISFLSLGSLGWIQDASFAVSNYEKMNVTLRGFVPFNQSAQCVRSHFRFEQEGHRLSFETHLR